MTLGRDFSTVPAFKAVCEGLHSTGCDHVEHLDLNDVNHFGQISAEENAVSKRLFMEFWCASGNGMAVLSAALSRGKVFLIS